MEQWTQGPVRSHLLPPMDLFPCPSAPRLCTLDVRTTFLLLWRSPLLSLALPLVCAVRPGLEFSLSRRISRDPGDGLLSSQLPTALVFGKTTWVSSERQGSRSWPLVRTGRLITTSPWLMALCGGHRGQTGRPGSNMSPFSLRMGRN